MVWGLAVDGQGDVSGKASGFGAGPVGVYGSVVAGLRAELGAHVALIGFNHVRTQTHREVEATDQHAHRAVDAVVATFTAPETPFEGLDKAPSVGLFGREVQGESRARAFEATVEVAMWCDRRPMLVNIDIRRAEERVGSDVGVGIDCGLVAISSPGSVDGPSEPVLTLPRRRPKGFSE